MNLIEQIKDRRSIRAFKADKPPRDLIVECLEAAAWAPNRSNQQPWRFIVLEGDRLNKVIAAVEENFATAFHEREEHPAPQLNDEIAKTLKERKRKTMAGIRAHLESAGQNIDSKGSGNFRFHDAPLGILFATYPSNSLNFCKSTIAAMQNFMLAANSKGLGTCWLSAIPTCQDHIKKAMGLAKDLNLVGGVAVGYPDDSPINSLPRERLPIEETVEWL